MTNAFKEIRRKNIFDKYQKINIEVQYCCNVRKKSCKIIEKNLFSPFLMRIKELTWVMQKVNFYKIKPGGSKNLGLTDWFSLGDFISLLIVDSFGL